MHSKIVGVLALQGSVEEHMHHLHKIDHIRICEVRTLEDIALVDGLILPGGESTTVGKLLDVFNLKVAIINRIKNGMPVWGTCAGMILLAKELAGDETVHLGMMDIKVKRNAYGSQLDSFTTNISVPALSKDDFLATFIRAPWIEEVYGDCEILATLDGKIIAAKQKNMLATSFHPELTDNIIFHKYFCDMI